MSAFRPLIQFLQNRLGKPLPGLDAQLKMAPDPVSSGPKRKLNAPEHAYQSSVLLLLFPNEEQEAELLLTLRSSNINHGGQISLPGGRIDENENPSQAALREAFEEVGIAKNHIKILGTLSTLYVSHSNNQVTPVVGYMERQPELTLNPAEVEEAFTVEVESLANKKNLTVQDWNLRQHTYKVPFWDVHRVPLWGATAMMLSEFLELYREFKQSSE